MFQSNPTAGYQCLLNTGYHELLPLHGKKCFVTAKKLGTTNIFFLLQQKISPQQPNVLLIELNILLLQQNIFVIPILTNDFVGITKPFIPCSLKQSGK